MTFGRPPNGAGVQQAVRLALRALTRAEERDPLLAGSGMIQGLPADWSAHRLLLYRAGIRAAAAALDKITASQSVRLLLATHELHRRARAWLDKLDDQVITLTDALSFAAMEDARCHAAVTFDRDFWIAGFAPFQPRR